MFQKLAQAVHGARWVHYDEDFNLLFVWHGGHGVHVHDETGKEVHFFNVGDFAKNEATLEEVQAGIKDVLDEWHQDEQAGEV